MESSPVDRDAPPGRRYQPGHGIENINIESEDGQSGGGEIELVGM